MRIGKDKKYKEEQEWVINELVKILQLDDNNSIRLYELDTNIEKKKKIMEF